MVKTKSRADPIDKFVGRSISTHRKARKLSQVQVAKKIGVTFQQIQKYESGINRVSASTLYKLAMLFDVSPADFFYGIGDMPENNGFVKVLETQDKEALQALELFSKIKNEDARKSFLTLMEHSIEK